MITTLAQEIALGIACVICFNLAPPPTGTSSLCLSFWPNLEIVEALLFRIEPSL